MTYFHVELKTLQGMVFKTLAEALKELLTETVIEFDPSGVKIVSINTSQTVLVHLHLEADKFEHYECERNQKVGINMLNLHKLLKTITNNDTLTIFIEKSDINNLGIKIEKCDKNIKNTYKLAMMDLKHPIKMPVLEFNKTITMPSADFQKICRDMSSIADFVEIKDVQNQLIFTCKGEFCSQETILCDSKSTGMHQMAAGDGKEDDEGGRAREDGSCGAGGADADPHAIVQGVFSIKSLVMFTKCTNLCDKVDLLMKNDFPLLVRYGVASLGEIKLLLSPHMEDDEDAGCATDPIPSGSL